MHTSANEKSQAAIRREINTFTKRRLCCAALSNKTMSGKRSESDRWLSSAECMWTWQHLSQHQVNVISTLLSRQNTQHQPRQSSAWLSWLRHGATENKLRYTFLHAQATFCQPSTAFWQSKQLHCLLSKKKKQKKGTTPKIDLRRQESGGEAQWHGVCFHSALSLFARSVESAVLQRSNSKPIAWHWCLAGWLLIDHINKEKRIKNCESSVFPLGERLSSAPRFSPACLLSADVSVVASFHPRNRSFRVGALIFHTCVQPGQTLICCAARPHTSRWAMATTKYNRQTNQTWFGFSAGKKSLGAYFCATRRAQLVYSSY